MGRMVGVDAESDSTPLVIAKGLLGLGAIIACPAVVLSIVTVWWFSTAQAAHVGPARAVMPTLTLRREPPPPTAGELLHGDMQELLREIRAWRENTTPAPCTLDAEEDDRLDADAGR